MIMPTFLGIIAFIFVVILIVIDRNKKLNEKVIIWIENTFLSKTEFSRNVAERAYMTIKGFLLIFCLFIILATIVLYT